MSINTNLNETGVSQEYVEGLLAYNQSDECLDFAIPTPPEPVKKPLTNRQVDVQEAPGVSQEYVEGLLAYNQSDECLDFTTEQDQPTGVSQEYVEGLLAYNQSDECLDFTTEQETEVSEEFVKELLLSDEFLNSIPEPSDRILSNAFSKFYGLVFNSKPSLHPHIDGGSTIPRAIVSLMEAIDDYIDTLDPIAHAKQIEALRKCQKALNRACNVYYLDKNNSMSKDKLAKEIQNGIAKMPIGSSLVIPGGSVGHAFLYEVVRLSKDKYFFTIVNTGEDQDFGDRVKSYKKNGQVDLYADKGYVTSASSLNVEFFKSILITSTEELSTVEVLKHLDNYFAQNGATPKQGRVHHEQARGNCTFKSLNRYLFGFLMDALGPDKGNALYKQFKVYRTARERNSIKDTIKKADKAALKRVWHTKNDEDLLLKLKEMDAASREILAKRQQKALQISNGTS
jgi:hypothetical protein